MLLLGIMAKNPMCFRSLVKQDDLKDRYIENAVSEIHSCRYNEET